MEAMAFEVVAALSVAVVALRRVVRVLEHVAAWTATKGDDRIVGMLVDILDGTAAGLDKLQRVARPLSLRGRAKP